MKILAWVVAIFLLLGSLLVALPFSSFGTRMLVHGINQTGMLRIEYASGTLFGDLQLQLLWLQVDAVDLRLEGVDTRLDIDCFWRSEFCFERLSVNSLRLEVGESGGDDTDDAEPALIEIPYAYLAPALQVASLHVSWPGGSWQQQGLLADLQLVNSVVEVASATIESPRLSIEESDDPDQSYQGFEPPPVFMPLGLSIGELNIIAGEFQLGASAQPIDAITLAGTWQGYDLRLERLSVASSALGQATAAGELSFNGDWPLSVDARANLTGTGNEWLDQVELDLSARGDLARLAVELTVAGEPDLSAQAKANLLVPGLPFVGSASASWPDNMTLAQLTGTQGQWAELTLRGPLLGSFEGNLQSQQFDIGGEATGLGYEQLRLQASGSLNGNQLELRSVQLSDPGSESKISASGQLRWGQGWALVADVVSPGVALPALNGPSPGSLAGRFKLLLDGSEDDWALRWRELDLSGEYRGLPALAQGEGGVNASLQLLPGTTRISANGAELKMQAEAGRGSTHLQFQLDDLGRWIAGAKGRVQLAGQGRLARQQLEFSGSAEDVLVEGVSVGRIDLDFNYDGAVERVAANVRVPDVGSAGYQLRDVALELSGTFASHRLQLASAGDVAGLLAVEGSWSSGLWTASLQPAKLATSSGDWTLEELVALQWSSEENRLSLAGHCWQHSEFRLCAEPSGFGDSGNLNLDLAGDVRAFNGLLPRGLRVRGRLDASLDMAWKPGQRLQLEAVAKARNMRTIRVYGMGERVSVDWQAIDIFLNRQDDDSLAISGSIIRDNQQVLSLQGRLPATREGSLSGRVDLNELKLSVLAPWVTELSELGGSLSGELALSGTPADPIFQGDVHLRDGRMVVVANPTVLSDMDVDISLRGKHAELSGTASLGGGDLALEGRISTEPELQVALTVSGDRHQILLPPASEFTVSEELTLVMTEELLDVRGEVMVLEGVLRHQELPAGSVGLSREVVVVDTLGNVIKQERPFDLSADIWLRIKDRFQVEGEGLRATLGGDLHVVAVPGEDPQVFGNLNLIGGELEAYRQRLQIRSGTIAFSGPVNNPGLNVVAERDIRAENITVGARLSGQLDEPVLEVYSDPVMSQGEAMSYLVRGRGLDAGAGADGTALALSMGASVVNRSGIVDGLNRLPLLSDVAFGASGAEDDTTATVSGYIGNRLYLSFGRGLYEPINVLTARLYLQSRLWLEVVSELENSADLYYSFDID